MIQDPEGVNLIIEEDHSKTEDSSLNIGQITREEKGWFVQERGKNGERY